MKQEKEDPVFAGHSESKKGFPPLQNVILYFCVLKYVLKCIDGEKMEKDAIEKLKQLKQQRSEINRKISEIEKEIIDEKEKNLRVLVGMCFRDNPGERIFRITAPYSLMQIGINYYQIPAIVVQEHSGEAPVFEDTIFSHACDSENVLQAFVAEGHEIISEKEFEESALEKTRKYIFSKKW